MKTTNQTIIKTNSYLLIFIFITNSLLAQTNKSTLEGKKLVTIGNSITAACGYQPYLVEWLGVNWSQEETQKGVDGHAPMAIGGTIVRPTSVKSILYRSYDAKFYNPDIIFVYGCQNDQEKSKWGSINDKPYLLHQLSDSVTLASAYMGMIENLKLENPKAQIYLINLMRVKAVVGMNPQNSYVKRYKSPRFETTQEVLDWELEMRYPKVQLVREIGKKYNSPVIDLYDSSGVTNANAELFYGQAADDCTQVHPNKEGYRRMAECIVKVLLPEHKIPNK
ncbi:MAG: SGNH/GDSL hydrolase family protein [Paludibacter sp.]